MKKIIDLLKHKWGEYVIEIVVITLGIFGAFILNNWNENRKEKQYEKSILLALKEDFLENQKELEKTLGRQNRVI